MHKGIYNGLSGPENKEENQCAIVLTEATIEDQGIWTCKVYIQGTVLMASKNLYIAGNNRNNHDNEIFLKFITSITYALILLLVFLIIAKYP